MQRSIIEEKSFEQSVAKLGGAQKLDAVLTAFYTGLVYRPEGFPLAGDSGLRIAKTESYFDLETGELFPPYRLYFFIMSDSGNVHLIWIEEIPDEDELPF